MSVLYVIHSAGWILNISNASLIYSYIHPPTHTHTHANVRSYRHSNGSGENEDGGENEHHHHNPHDDTGSLSRSASESSVAQAHIENGLNINNNGYSNKIYYISLLSMLKHALVRMIICVFNACDPNRLIVVSVFFF